MKETVSVTFSCGHEGEVETETSIAMTFPEVESTLPADPESVQYIIFQRKLMCPSCDSALWEVKK